MIDLNREYKALTNKLNRYKKKKLAFECGCACGYVTDVRLTTDDLGFPDSIEVLGIAGMDAHVRVLMVVLPRMVKGKDYKYWKEYHILERFY